MKMSIYRDIINSEERKKEYYQASAYTEVFTNVDSLREIQPEGSTPALGEELIFKLPVSGEMFLQSAVLSCTLSPITSPASDTTRRYVGVTGLNILERIQLYHNSELVMEVKDFVTPYIRWLTFMEHDKILPKVKTLINDVANATLNTQATGSGVTTYLKLDYLLSAFSHPIPLGSMRGPLELRIRFKGVPQVVVSTDAGATCSLTRCKLETNYIEPGPTVARYADSLVKSGNLRWQGYRYLESTTNIAGGQTNFSVNLSSFIDKSAAIMFFYLRKQSDLSAKSFYAYQPISSWSLKSAGRRVDNNTDDWTATRFNGAYLLENHLRNIDAIDGKNIYFINWSNNLNGAFGHGEGEVEEFYGGMDFTGFTDLTLAGEFPAALVGDHRLDVVIVIPGVVSTAGGQMKFLE